MLTKPNVHQALAELRRISFRFDVWPKGGESVRCCRRRAIKPGDPFVWREETHDRKNKNHPSKTGLGMCLECATVALEKHRALVFDLEGRAERDTLVNAKVELLVTAPGSWKVFEDAMAQLTAAATKQFGEALSPKVKPPSVRVLENLFWEVPSLGQVAVLAVSETVEGYQVSFDVEGAPERFRRQLQRFPCGKHPEEFGWRVADRMTPDGVRERLGLEPFEAFKGALAARGLPSEPQRGRGSGRTTKMLCAAIARASEGKRPVVLVHDEAFGLYLRRELETFAEELGPLGSLIVKRIEITARRERWEGVDPACAFVDHEARRGGST